MATSEKLRVKTVRLSFPQFWTPKAFEEGQTPRYEGAFLFDYDNKVHAQHIKEIKAAAKGILTEHFGGKIPKGVKFCFGDADKDEKTYDGYEGKFYLTSANRTRPPIVDRDGKSPLIEADGKPYAGCYVNATVTLWVQDNKWGKRVNANLLAVQFVKDGEAFGIKPVDVEEEFEDIEDEDSEIDDNYDDTEEGEEEDEDYLG